MKLTYKQYCQQAAHVEGSQASYQAYGDYCEIYGRNFPNQSVPRAPVAPMPPALTASEKKVKRYKAQLASLETHYHTRSSSDEVAFRIAELKGLIAAEEV